MFCTATQLWQKWFGEAPEPDSELIPYRVIPHELGQITPTPAPGLLTVLQIDARTCKWPIGEVGRDGFGFCGKPSDKGSSYCPTHRNIAFRVSS